MKTKKYFSKNVIILLTTAITALFLTAARNGQNDSLDQWIKSSTPVMLEHLYENISPSGTAPGVIVASPSRQNPNYYYYWIRDGALVMNVVVDQYISSKNQSRHKFYQDRLDDFISLTRRNQHTPNPSNGPGEPKFNVDGSAFTGDWGRPQNDGPALRAITLIRYANLLLNDGQKDKVRKLLYDGSSDSVIKLDLEYVSHNWQSTCFDLWEETRGHHFYTQFVQRAALVLGSQLARRMGDEGAASWYGLQADRLEKELQRYWDGQRRVIVETIDRDGGADYKTSNLDTGVILGLLHGSLDDGFFAFSDERVLGTVRALEKAFQDIYAVNNKGYRGIAIGRYPEDRYTGVDLLFVADGGNPWFLTTLGFAEFYYRLARDLTRHGTKIINNGNLWFFRDFGYDGKDISGLAKALRDRGDDFMATAQFHMSNGRMSEQINRNSGYMQGAHDLTWSYASFLTAAKWR
ncbi:MAG: glycoside hydrolase family 15 protein [Pseudomonadota bacterium]|nr:glycoside hydrolase family 15 protein [Pseudomonadota bacterium]